MKHFSIKELERFTSIKAHTLRVWEMRYGIPESFRSKNNTRYYTIAEIIYVLQLSILNKNGFKISYLATLSRSDVANIINRQKRDDLLQEIMICNLINYMFTQNNEEFELVLDECFKKWPARITLEEILVPFLKKVNLFWHGNHLTEEHLVVTIIRKKILFAIEQIKQPVYIKQKVVLFLHDVSQLDLALLYVYFCLRNKGIGVIYMGNDISIHNVSEVLRTSVPQYIFTYLPQKNNFSYETLLNTMNKVIPDSSLVVTMYPFTDIIPAISGKIIFAGIEDALRLLSGSHEP